MYCVDAVQVHVIVQSLPSGNFSHAGMRADRLERDVQVYHPSRALGVVKSNGASVGS